MNGLPYLDGQRISLSRLIRFEFPADAVIPDLTPEAGVSFETLLPRVLVVAEISIGGHVRIHVCRVRRTFPANAQLEVEVWHVAPSERYGPWTRRLWSPLLNSDGSQKVEVIPVSEVICLAELCDHALTPSCLELLVSKGVPVEGQPRRESAIPPRTA